MDWRKLKENQKSWQIFKMRADVVDLIRQFFKNERFLEVETPIMARSLIPESYLEIFKTELKDKLGKKTEAFLTPSPEIWHKKLLVAGSGNIFEITKSFRNTDIGGHFHNPEFSLLEWYRVGADYKDTMVDCEKLIRKVNHEKPEMFYQGNEVRINAPFERISISNAFEKYAGIKTDELFNREVLLKFAKKKKYHLSNDSSWDDLYNFIFLTEIEPKLGFGRPTIIFDFPAKFAPLAKTSSSDPRFKERFELYICGVELADAYNELADPKEQERQLKKEMSLRKKAGMTLHPLDDDFINALRSGLPGCSGVALGVDRLVMIMADKTDIGEVMFFSGTEIFK
jgi:elongation factor P--(R)-beta-lysine ligase